MSTSQSVRISTALFLGLHLVAPHVDGYVFWGFDFLAHYGTPVQLLFLAFSLVLVFPPSAKRLTKVSFIIYDAAVARPRISSFLLVVASGICFIHFQVATHLLGDGYLHIRQLAATGIMSLPSLDRAPLVFWTAKLLHHAGSSIWQSPETTYRLLSWTSGISYVVIVVVSAGKLFDTRVSRAAWFGVMLTGGYLLLFFGYVETYPLLLPLCLLYLVVGARAADGRGTLVSPGVLITILIGVHLAMVTLVPSFAFLCWIRMRSGKSIRSALDGSGFRKGVALAVLIAAVLALFQLRHHVLPLYPQSQFSYAMFSLGHGIELLNQYLLVAPAALLLLPLIINRTSFSSNILTFAFSAALFAILGTVVANPSIGAFRDWDAFAFAGLPLSFWTTLVLARTDRREALELVLPVCVAALLHTALLVGVNTDQSRSEERFRRCLLGAPMTTYARGYGWEVYGSYLKDRGRLPEAITAFEQGTRANPKHHRLWTNLGFLQLRTGSFEPAVANLSNAVELNPGSFDGWLHLGVALHQMQEPSRASVALSKALEIRPGDPEANYRIAELYYDRGELGKAVRSYEQALKAAPTMVEAKVNLALVLVRLGQDEEARHLLEASLQNLATVVALQMLGEIHVRAGRHNEGAVVLKQAIDAGADSAPVYGNLANALFTLGQYELAVRYYEEATLRQPEMAGAFYGLAAANIQLGLLNRAKTYADQFARLSPDDPRLPALLQRLGSKKE